MITPPQGLVKARQKLAGLSEMYRKLSALQAQTEASAALLANLRPVYHQTQSDPARLAAIESSYKKLNQALRAEVAAVEKQIGNVEERMKG